MQTLLIIQRGEIYKITVPADTGSVISSATVWNTYFDRQDALNASLAASSELILGPYLNITTFRVEYLGGVTIEQQGVDFSVPVSPLGDIKIQGNTISDGENGININDAGTEEDGINVGGVTYDIGLRVNDIGGNSPGQFIAHKHSTTLESIFLGSRSNSDTSAHADVENNMALSTFYAAGWAGSNYKLFAGIKFSADSTGTVSNTSAPGKIELQVSLDGVVVPTTALTIKNDKRVQIEAYQNYQEQDATPADPTDGAEANIYVKADKLVIQYNDADTVRYKYLDLTGTGVTWVHTTTAP